MEETKRCPYCGEEILAVAKKCKHCRKWLNEDPTSQTTAEIAPENEQSTTEMVQEMPPSKSPGVSCAMVLASVEVICIIVGLLLLCFISFGEKY